MNPQVEIRIKQYVQLSNFKEWCAMVKAQIQHFLAGINKPFCENEFNMALAKGPHGRLTLAGIDFRIKEG